MISRALHASWRVVTVSWSVSIVLTHRVFSGINISLPGNQGIVYVINDFIFLMFSVPVRFSFFFRLSLSFSSFLIFSSSSLIFSIKVYTNSCSVCVFRYWSMRLSSPPHLHCWVYLLCGSFLVSEFILDHEFTLCSPFMEIFPLKSWGKYLNPRP